MQKPEIPLLSPLEFIKAVEDNSSAVIIDVRKPEEFEAGHIEGAQLLDFLDSTSFDAGIRELDKSKNYYIHCRSGVRSHKAALKMVKEGLNVVEMEGGILAYEKAELPLVQAADEKK